MRTHLTAAERAEHASASRKKWYRANKERYLAWNVEWRRQNREKALLYYKRYRDKHREELNKRSRLETRNNPEKRVELNRSWRTRFPDRHKACVAKWCKENPHRVRLIEANRRATKKKQMHAEHNRSIELLMIKDASELTKKTGVMHHIDHIIPLHVGGWHHHLNLQVLPRSMNSAKNDNAFWECDGYKSWRDVPESLWPTNLIQAYADNKYGVAV